MAYQVRQLDSTSIYLFLTQATDKLRWNYRAVQSINMTFSLSSVGYLKIKMCIVRDRIFWVEPFLRKIAHISDIFSKSVQIFT